MSSYALIKGGIVENIILADQEYIDQLAQQLPIHDEYVLLPEKEIPPFLGSTYDGKDFIPPAPIVPPFLDLYKAENAYIEFCRSLGLSDVATSEEFTVLTDSMIANGEKQEAYDLSVKRLGLLNAITENGGIFKEITFHEEIL